MVLLALVAVFAASRVLGERVADRIESEAMETLAIQAEALSGILDKYRVLPPLLARQEDVKRFFLPGDHSSDFAEEARQKAEEAAGLSGANEVAFLTPGGDVLASARNFFSGDPAGAQELVSAAEHGLLGRAVVSINPARRAYAFGSGVRHEGRLIGIIAVYVDFSTVEATWSLTRNPIFVLDDAGIVFLTNRPDWQLRAIDEIATDRGGSARYQIGQDIVPVFDFVRYLPLLDWQLHVVADRRPVASAQVSAGLTAGLVCLLLALGGFYLIQRQNIAWQQKRQDRATALRLERLVAARTQALSETNLSLSHEIEVRTAAEERLRRTQNELVQAGKLAALGQMSAALSHEFNQPLAAIKTLSENGSRFLAKGQQGPVSDNLVRIGGLVDRMAELSRTLLSFARKPGTTVGAVALGPILDEAIMLTQPRAKKAGVKLELGDELRKQSVVGGRIRLGQVFVNLINNAVDASSSETDGSIFIGGETDANGDIRISVSDNGSGIPEEELSKVFDPFFTTKDVGEGIGIGLSIAYNIVRDFGGTIEVSNRPEGGAKFTVCLKAADADHTLGEVAAE